MASKTKRDVQLELTELEIEEARIMRELREMDEKANVARLRVDAKGDSRAVLNGLLAECEREVREAKGYIKSTGPPLRIARCKRGEAVPAHATFLSRPKGTEVDFTVPVTLKEYNDAIKHPIFLDGIRQKCKSNAYNTMEEYVADMRLLARNTAAFNKGPELSWVVQHAKLLLETAEESVELRRSQLQEAQAGIVKTGSSSRQMAGKRKRSSTGSHDANGANSALQVGTVIQIFWDSDRKWYTATIIEKGEGSQVLVEYQNEGSEWLDLHHEVKWRLPPSSGRSKRIADNASNKRKKGSSSVAPVAAPAHGRTSHHRHSSAPQEHCISPEALQAVREEFLTALEETKTELLGGINDRFQRVETALQRSDALHRVLLAVHDVQQSMTSSIEILAKNMANLQTSVSNLTARVNEEKEVRTPDKVVPAQPVSPPGATEQVIESATKEVVPDTQKDVSTDVAEVVEVDASPTGEDSVEIVEVVQEEVTNEQTPEAEIQPPPVEETPLEKSTEEPDANAVTSELKMDDVSSKEDDAKTPEKTEEEVKNVEQTVSLDDDKKPDEPSSEAIVQKERSDGDETVKIPVNSSDNTPADACSS